MVEDKPAEKTHSEEPSPQKPEPADEPMADAEDNNGKASPAKKLDFSGKKSVVDEDVQNALSSEKPAAVEQPIVIDLENEVEEIKERKAKRQPIIVNDKETRFVFTVANITFNVENMLAWDPYE